MAGIKPLIVGILLAGLFALALINGGILIAEHNNANQSIGDDPALQSFQQDINESLLQAQENANGSLTNLGNSPTSQVSGGILVYDAISGTWLTLKETPVDVYNTEVGLVRGKIFGGGFSVVFAILGAIVIILIIFGVIKLFIQGQDE